MIFRRQGKVSLLSHLRFYLLFIRLLQTRIVKKSYLTTALKRFFSNKTNFTCASICFCAAVFYRLFIAFTSLRFAKAESNSNWLLLLFFVLVSFLMHYTKMFMHTLEIILLILEEPQWVRSQDKPNLRREVSAKPEIIIYIRKIKSTIKSRKKSINKKKKEWNIFF